MNNFPNFHKRNKGQIGFPKFHTKEEIQVCEKELEYPFNSIPYTDGVNASYYKYANYIQLFEKGLYKELLNTLLPEEGSGAGLTTILTLSLGPAGYFAGSNIANERNRFISFTIASCYYKLGNYSRALNHLNKIDSRCYWDRLYFLKAWTLYKLGYKEDSKDYFKKAFIKNPSLMDHPCPVEVSLM